MAQSKKAAVRAAILEAAFRLFSEKSYAGATVPQIAAGAGVSPANVYVYFHSKLDIIFAIYEPWLRQRIAALEHELDTAATPERRLHCLLTTLWRDIPAANNGFTSNIMQAIAEATPEQGYESTLIRWAEARLAGMIERIFRDAGRAAPDAATLAHVLFMAFDGFSINFNLNPWAACSDRLVDNYCRMLLPAPTAARRKRADRRRPRDRDL